MIINLKITIYHARYLQLHSFLQPMIHVNLPGKTKIFRKKFRMYKKTNKKSEMKELQCHSNGKLSVL